MSLKAEKEKERRSFLQTEPRQSKGAGEKILSVFLEGSLWLYNGTDLKSVQWKQLSGGCVVIMVGWVKMVEKPTACWGENLGEQGRREILPTWFLV